MAEVEVGKVVVPPTWAITVTFGFKDGFSKTLQAQACAANVLDVMEAEDVDGLDLADMNSLTDKYKAEDITSMSIEVHRVA